MKLFAALLLSLAVLTLTAQSARAETRTISGGESRLQVHILNFLKLVGDGIWISPIQPARIEYGSNPTAFFPIRNIGVIDPAVPLGTVSHDGGLQIDKASINQSVQVTNLTVTCEPLTGCRVLGTANQAIPNEVAELHDVTITDDQDGTVTVQGRALVGQAASIALNALFQTTVFQPGMELGTWTSQVQYVQSVTYPRPSSARKVQTTLVPAFTSCTTPNRQHGPPLAGGSCSPPATESSAVRPGTQSTGNAKFLMKPGSLSTTEDEADVGVVVNATDMRDAGAGDDYAGDLTARVTLRMTDRSNGLLPGGGSPGTVQDLPLSVAVPCVATTGPAGATCSVSTTVDTVVPGAVLEGRRSVWELGQVAVLDSVEAPVLRQGIFVP